ncbi:ergothioneine biosynthesis protein EgtC [Streptomyces yaanensis]|uniref:Gamma-glutamyl-hercynylcysteine sulfoxide hydrolase n=1 Tax=Streptomyces yaanensis TaxID=1142239 RepID=A0ABV7S7S4_9ACTN|nr:ergothioneine biosynthesis protein EgtC [Streptomyces sp. CGMCC 4.7035]WNC00061.1 ergothioneine biosynthesis protein EgtC [Streptomyces sp. CGMCC 4.7035]
MCRHLAFLGPEEPLGGVLVEPPHSLYRQSWAPRKQRHGTVNADGFGVGWYAEGDPVPARYRRAGPIWGDQSFADLARVVRSGAFLAAVRDATEGSAAGEAAAAPFAAGRWLFSHNGAVAGWPRSVADLAGSLPPAELLSLEARCDSAFVWALVLDRLRAGDDGGQALADTVAAVAAAAPASRLNLLLTNGETITATAWGDTLWYLAEPGRLPQGLDSARPGGIPIVVASEPYDDDPRWQEVPDRTLLAATRTDVQLTPLKDPRDEMASAPPEEPST